MNPELKKIVDLNNELSKKVQASLPIIINSLQKGKFQRTGKALISFVAKSGSLNNSILNSCLNGDLYSAWVSFRPMVEHNFKHLYIYTKALNDNSDSVGSEYYNNLKASEDLESMSKIINYNKVVHPDKTQWSTKGEHNKAIKQKAKQFDIEQIFYYLISNNNSDEDGIISKAKKDYFLDRLVGYTSLSSAVHGGAFADLGLEEVYKTEGALEKNLCKYALDSFMLFKSLVEATYLFASLMDESVNQYYEEIKNIKI